MIIFHPFPHKQENMFCLYFGVSGMPACMNMKTWGRIIMRTTIVLGSPPYWSLVSCHFWDLNNQFLICKTPMTTAVVIGLSVFNFEVLIGKLNHINDGNMMGSHWLQANKFFGQLLDFSVTCHLSIWSLWSGFLEQISGNTERVPISPGRCSSGERSVVSTLTSP